jgi:hypothetical protein
MSLHELFARSSRGRARRRLRMARRGHLLPGLPRRRPAGSVRATARGLRRLAAIDRALAVETPRLASMFAIFNELAGGEPVGAERLPARARPRLRLRLAHVAFLATLAAFVALCVMLSTQLPGVMRPCLSTVPASSRASSAASPTALSTAPPAGSSAAPPAGSSAASSAAPLPASPAAAPFGAAAASPAASPAAGQASASATWSPVFLPLRGLSCQAYAAPNK